MNLDDAKKWLNNRISKTSECWIWTKAVGKNGYARCNRYKVAIFYNVGSAHQLSYVLYNGPLNKNMVIMHTCDNTKCCNPDHLIQATQADNIKDKVKKNRQAKGNKQHLCKLNEMKALEIFQNKQNMTTRELAKQYNVSQRTIMMIRNKESWKHIHGNS